MRKIYYLALVALVGMAFSSCSLMGDKEPSWTLSDLQGLWLENGDATVGHYVRFTAEQSDETGFLLAREWTTSEDKKEQDLLDQQAKDGFPGNGWFKYQLASDGTLQDIHLMKNGGAEVPKYYKISKLNATKLEYYEKEFSSNKFSFTKAE
ncbi:MAG: hypothetical protein IJS82_02645 [Paludibacteraceae bacterium]|nr:hypothetical protein [Paludibacteraceae bacterium]